MHMHMYICARTQATRQEGLQPSEHVQNWYAGLQMGGSWMESWWVSLLPGVEYILAMYVAKRHRAQEAALARLSVHIDRDLVYESPEDGENL